MFTQVTIYLFMFAVIIDIFSSLNLFSSVDKTAPKMYNEYTFWVTLCSPQS